MTWIGARLLRSHGALSGVWHKPVSTLPFVCTCPSACEHSDEWYGCQRLRCHYLLVSGCAPSRDRVKSEEKNWHAADRKHYFHKPESTRVPISSATVLTLFRGYTNTTSNCECVINVRKSRLSSPKWHQGDFSCFVKKALVVSGHPAPLPVLSLLTFAM